MINIMRQGKGDSEDKPGDDRDNNLVNNPEKYPNNDVEKMLAFTKTPMMYYVLMYKDGCTLIPRTWVNISERTYAWPTKPILSRSKMHTLIPSEKWAFHKYVSHLGPYSTFADALEVERICSNLSSTDDNDAIQSTVEKLLRSKKRTTKTKDLYSDCSEQPPPKYIAQERKSSRKDINEQDAEARPPAGYIVSNPEEEIQDPSDPYHFEAEYSQVSSNQGENSDIGQPSTSGMKSQHKENMLSQKDLENKPIREYSGNKSFAAQKSRGDKQCDGNLKHPRIREQTIITTELPAGIQAMLKRNRKDGFAAQGAGDGECSFDDATTEENFQTCVPKRSSKKSKTRKRVALLESSEVSSEGETLYNEQRPKVALRTYGRPIKEIASQPRSVPGYSEQVENDSLPENSPRSDEDELRPNIQREGARSERPTDNRQRRQELPHRSGSAKQPTECPECKDICCLKLRNTMQVILRKINLLLEPKLDGTGMVDEEASVLPQFPLKTMTDMKSFDRLLGNSETAQKQFKNTMCMIGGRNLKRFVSNVLAHLIADRLAAQYTWTGIRNTNKIKHMKFIALLIETLVVKVRGSTKDEVTNYAQEWFRRAGDRMRTAAKELAQH